MRTIVYDAGALIAAEGRQERMWAIHQRTLARGVTPVIPSTVLAQVWRGGPGQHMLGHLIRSFDVEDLTRHLARESGVLLARAPHGVVDASVVECGLRRRSPCVTSNRHHLVELAGDRGTEIIDI